MCRRDCVIESGMLFITRKETERVVIMNEIEVEILKIEDDCVSIGVKAPPDIPIHRHEVFKKIKAKKLRAQSPAG
jgi:carbon storage regulator